MNKPIAEMDEVEFAEFSARVVRDTEAHEAYVRDLEVRLQQAGTDGLKLVREIRRVRDLVTPQDIEDLKTVRDFWHARHGRGVDVDDIIARLSQINPPE